MCGLPMPKGYPSGMLYAMSQPSSASALSPVADGVRLAIKVVPGASRSAIKGMLGDRLKVAVAAPPENGKANKAVCALLADAFGLPPRDVVVSAGHTNPLKSIDLIGLSQCKAAEALQRLLQP